MGIAEKISRIDRKLRETTVLLPPEIVIRLYSQGRTTFLKTLEKEKCAVYNPDGWERTLWGITFGSPIMNGAGMFKNGECYHLMAAQGAGGYIGGTTTWNPRVGNKKRGIKWPFCPYPRSRMATNWMGLPNNGDQINAKRVSRIQTVEGCPIGWSLMRSPDYMGTEAIEKLLEGMKLYAKSVDFIEINESCPNTKKCSIGELSLEQRMQYISERFIQQNKTPVVVKFSNDVSTEQIPYLLDLLFEKGFAGVNFGNTSVDYEGMLEHIHPKEKRLFKWYTELFGGGVSGKPLKEKSLELCSLAVDYLRNGKPAQEFHVIRTGGIECLEDIKESEAAGISMNEWLTGYFENYSKNGNKIYKKLLEERN